MGQTLVMLPEAPPTSRLLCEYVFRPGGREVGPVDLMILRKQRKGFQHLIDSFPFREVHELDEEFYGRVTKDSTREFITQRLKAPYDVAYFPFNTFRGNAYFLGSVLAREVKAVNSSLYGKRGEVPMVSFGLGSAAPSGEGEVPWGSYMDEVRDTMRNIGEIVRSNVDTFEASGERPSLGILQGFAHDLEIFCKYALGAGYVRGKRVLDIGGGIGYGSFLLSRFAKEVVFVDRSKETVELARKLWSGARPNFRAVCGDIDTLPVEGGFDVVFLMDVIEHVPDPEKILRKARGLMKDDGLLIVTTPEEDFYPYSVCPRERWGENEERLISEAIWPWHIQALGEEKLLPLLERTGFKVRDKSYTTYLKGGASIKGLREAVEREDAAAVVRSLNDTSHWDLSDFGTTCTRDPFFSAASYNVIAGKAL